jgi:membrane protease YdiL (CAAX protease family)
MAKTTPKSTSKSAARRPPNRFIPPALRYLPDEAPWHKWAWLGAAALLIPLIYYIQHFTLDLRGQTLETVPRQVVERETPDEPGISHLTLESKVMVRLSRYAREMEEEDRPDPAHLDPIALSRVDRLRVAIVAGELKGPKEALQRIEALQKEATPDGEMAHELEWVRRAYVDGPDSLPEEARQSLVDRHGWFGELLLVRGHPNGEPARRSVVGGGARLLGTFTVLGLQMLLSFVIGVVALIMMMARINEGRFSSRFDEGVGGLIHLETFVVFAGCFLLLLCVPLVMFGMNAEASTGAVAVEEVLLWCLPLVLLWPVIRKVPWRQFAIDVGLHTGEGVGKEVMCGVVGWLVTVPISFGVALVLRYLLRDSEDHGPQGYPLFNPPAGGTWVALWLSALSAVVWAPLLEEVMFRGALYRYLRPGLSWVGAVLVSSAVFGFVHPYTTAGLLSVGILGTGLGLLREWRGSLIAPMTCHLLHNASITLATAAIVAAID